MKTIVIFILSLWALITCASCERQDLEDPYTFLAHIPIVIDWSESLLEMEKVGNVSMYFYPVDGGAPIVKPSGNLYYNVVKLPVGEYRVLIFNDLVDNIKGIGWNGVDDYSSFRVSSNDGDQSSPRFYEPSDDEVVLFPHDRVASWSLDEFVVDEDMVKYTRTYEFEEYSEKLRSLSMGSKGASGAMVSAVLPDPISPITKSTTKSLESISHVVPQPETTIVNVKVRVKNLNNVMTFESVLRGTSRGAYMTNEGSTVNSGETNIYQQIVDVRDYDDPKSGIDGYVTYSHNTFGRFTDDDTFTMSFRIALKNGVVQEFERDVTKFFEYDEDHIVYIVFDDIDGSGGTGTDPETDPDKDPKPEYDPDNDGSIDLPAFSEAGFSVGNWGDRVEVYL